jgi:hypothetical protein
MPLYVRSRNLCSLEGLIRQLSTLPPCSRFCGIIIRVHLAIREDSLGGIVTGGRELRDNAFGEVFGGPPTVGDSRLIKGADCKRTSRSWEGIEKNP